MNSDKKTLYIMECICICLLLPACFVQKGAHTNLILAVGAVLAAFAFSFFLKKRSLLAIQHKQVALLTLAAAIIAIFAYYATGYGFGFSRTVLVPAYWYENILPYTAAIIACEQLRRVLLSQESRVSFYLSYFLLTLFDVLLFMQERPLRTFSGFADLCGLVVLSAITANVLYHYLSGKYGALPAIAYKLAVSIYPFLFPIKPSMPQAMYAFFKLLLPLLLLYFIRSLYERKIRTTHRKNTILAAVFTALTVAVLTAFVMLISCRFRYGLLVVSTESMTGTLNKGDAITYEQYEDQPIKEGQILVFTSNKVKTVHRVVDVEKINGELRIFTKGDANDSVDSDYITTEDIIGIQKLKIKYLGYPTVWMRELFK